MGRLPEPGKDQGVWGTVLNDYLQVSHDANGAIKAGAVSEANLSSDVRTKLNQTPTVGDGTVTETKLASALQTKINGKADTSSLAVVATTGDYNDLTNKPVGPSISTTDDLPEGTTNKYYHDTLAAAAAPVQSVNTRTGAVVVTKGDVGLGAVDNTSDNAKPVSGPMQTALNTKANLSGAAFTGNVSVAGTISSTDTVNGRDVAADGTKLDGIQAGAQPNIVTSVATRTGDVVLTKSDVGLSNVNDTTDLGKPVSTATQSALDAKANLSGAAFTGNVSTTGTLTSTGTVNGRNMATDGTKLDGIQAGAQTNTVTSVATRTGAITLTKADVGLSLVDNTSDNSKPVSAAMQTALDAKAATSSLAPVATSGSYADVTNKPLIVLGPTDPVPGGTPAGTVIIRKTS